MQASATFPPEPKAAREARHFTARHLRDWRQEHLDILVALLVTELVTNSILHARTRIEVTLIRTGEGVRVAVRDGSERRPIPRHVALDATTGRGLALVEQLGRRWGVDLDDGGKTVWVDVVPDPDVSGRPGAPATEPGGHGAPHRPGTAGSTGTRGDGSAYHPADLARSA